MIQELEQRTMSGLNVGGSGEDMKKRAYVKVSGIKRKLLVELMQREQLNIKTAAARLNINYSAAKHIVKLFKQERRFASLTKESKGGEYLTRKRSEPEKAMSPTQAIDIRTSVRTPELTATKLPDNKKTDIFDFTVYTTRIYESYLRKYKHY